MFKIKRADTTEEGQPVPSSNVLDRDADAHAPSAHTGTTGGHGVLGMVTSCNGSMCNDNNRPPLDVVNTTGCGCAIARFNVKRFSAQRTSMCDERTAWIDRNGIADARRR